ncbi:hypothetical protein [Stagnihabitans tardus]|uniref:DUF3563 domain-containing protein n=1 Tax=Stagnihabitans tardus TaxID=2699202 RepID=A0AAE5BTD4_9RHOB|nr:hypothetical protein [Stagnihabitans tardus]NBZ86571.1 hypothetical protein [Stagnihabitans tardus]
MSLIQSLLARFSRPKADEPDAFALRLDRIQSREKRLRARGGVFRAYAAPQAG